MPTTPTKKLETFPNPHPDRDYIIELETPEFTCLCPKTGQPDFATLQLEYVPDQLCVELKALKLYIWSYRNEGAFHEKVTNTILDDLVQATQPRYLRLCAQFNVRGGIYTTVTAEYRKPGWKPPPARPEGLDRQTQEFPGREENKTDSQKTVTPPEPSPTTSKQPETLTVPTVSAPVAPATAPPGGRFHMLRRARAPIPIEPTDIAATEQSVPPPKPQEPVRDIYIGIDLGSTGCRAVAIAADGALLAHAEAPMAPPMQRGTEITQDPTQWWKALTACVQQLSNQIDAQRVHRLAVDGTSGTLLLCDSKGAPVSPALMYNDQRAQAQAELIVEAATTGSGAHGATSSLAKLLWLQDTKSHARAAHALHQAEWITNRLTGIYGHGDMNNCLKLGFDAQEMAWPDWFAAFGIKPNLLPQIHPSGEVLGTLLPKIAETLGLTPEIEVVAGTTDGVAAFLATGATQPGHAVTSLGTTLTLKLLSREPLFSERNGVYSHRLGNYWLAGGASNSGGCVLLRYFNEAQLREMTPLLDPEHPTDLNYYPLLEVGERFPVNDPQMMPRLEPLPGDSATFLQGMLEGIARIEADGYRLLEELGAPKVSAIWTTGGGSHNPAWTRIRERNLGIKIQAPLSEHAAYGAALLASGVIAKNFQ